MNKKEYDQIIEKYRDEKPPLLPFHMSAARLVDLAHCAAFCDELQRTNTKWEQHLATEQLGDHLPAARGLYMFVWRPELRFEFEHPRDTFRPGWVIYVGKAGVSGGTHDTIRQRYVTEYSGLVGNNPELLWHPPPNDDRATRLARYLSVRPLEYWFLLLDEPDAIKSFEKRLIKILNPPANQQHGLGGRLRVGNTEPA